MKLLLRLMKDEFVFYALILCLIFWSFFSSLHWAFQKNEAVVVEKDERGLLRVLGKEDKASSADIFIAHFIMLAFSYDKSTFKSQISQAGVFMSDGLWKKKSGHFLKVLKQVEKENLSQFVEILKLHKTSQDVYEAQVKVTVFRKDHSEEKKGKIVLKIRKKKINLQNFYGLEVTDVQVL